MATVTRRYKFTGPAAACLTRGVGCSAAPKSQFLGTVVDIDLDDGVDGSEECLDEFMGLRGFTYDASAKPVAGARSRFSAGDAALPGLGAAQSTARNDHRVLAFDDSSVESAIFEGVIPQGYSGEDLEILIHWVAATATADDVVWGGEWERDNAAGHDIDANSFAAQRTQTATAPGTAGQVKVTTITFTQAQADGVVAGDAFRLRLQRVATDGGDDMAGDAQVLRLSIREK